MPCVKQYNLLKLFFPLFLIIPSILCGQSNNTSSPYSRFGIGDIAPKGLAQGFGLGGSCIALQNDSTPIFFINSANPASYSSIRLTTVELGVNYAAVQMKNATTSKTAHNADLAYVTLAFPIKRWWGSSIGLLPYSSVGYAIVDHDNIDSVGNVDYLYEGNGGVNQLYFGNAIKPLYGLPSAFVKSKRYKRLLQENQKETINRILKRRRAAQELSLGFNISYLFGSLENSKRSIFYDNPVLFNSRSKITTRFSDVNFDYGVQYAFTIDTVKGRDLKDKVKIMLGATFSARTDIAAKVDTFNYSYYYGSSGEEIFRDTVRQTVDKKGYVRFPLSFGFGWGLKKGERWLLTTDFAAQNWSSYEAFHQSQDLKNSWRVSAGVQYTPNARFVSTKGAFNGYHKRIQYRMGGRYAQTALELKNTLLKEVAISLGAGFPVGRNFLLQNFSMVNVGVELGRRGTVSNNLIQETFFKVNIGFTLNDRWFVKPSID